MRRRLYRTTWFMMVLTLTGGLLLASLSALPRRVGAQNGPWAASMSGSISVVGEKAHEATPQAAFVVDSSADDANARDKNPGDGFCLSWLDECTLRAAIEEANAWAGADTITFSTTMTIYIDTTEGALPSLSEQARIDASGVWDGGNDQPGVSLNGSGGGFWGLALNADSSEIYGLHITNFGGSAIYITSTSNIVGGTGSGQRNVVSGNSTGVHLSGSNAHDNVIQGNWIGLSVTGDSASPNTTGVMLVSGAYNNTIGGNTADKGNYISGNSGPGVQIQGSGTDGNAMYHNTIGLAANGIDPVPNASYGVYIAEGVQGAMVGGTMGGNTIAANDLDGVHIYNASSNYVESNTITGNANQGVYLNDASNNQVLVNTIAYNTGNGVLVHGATATSNLIAANSIHNNGLAGIELLNGGNTELAAPTITSATPSSVSGTACASCVIHVFSDSSDEGETYHGSVTADPGGNWVYAGTISGPNATATNTDSSNNTSEFSLPEPVGGGGGTCADPLPIACGQVVNEDTTNYNNNISSYTCAAWDESGPEIIYAFTLTGGTNYTVTAELLSFGADLDIFLLATGGCDAGQCLDANSYGDVIATAGNVPPGSYYIAVDGYQGVAGAFDLQLTCTPADDTCTPVTAVEIDGPTSGMTNTVYGFGAVITPAGATEPITYDWVPGPATGQGTANVTYQWALPGTYVITVTASNCGLAGVTDLHTITISGGVVYRIFLPITHK